MRKLLTRLFSTPTPFEEGRRLLSQGRHLEAAHLLERLVSNGTADADLQELYIQVLCAQQRYEAALTIARALINTEGSRPTTQVLVGICFEATGKSQDAIAAYRQALQQDPTQLEATTRICRLLSMGDEKAEALRIVETALSRYPVEVDLVFCRGNVRFALGDSQGARRDFEAVWEAEPTHRHAMSNLAVVATEQGDLPEAERWLRRALERSPSDFDLKLRLAQNLHLRQRSQEALDILFELREERPDQVEVHSMIGELHAFQQQLPDAAIAFAQAALLDVSNPEPYLQLGKVFFEFGNYDEAVKTLQKSLAIRKSAETYRMNGLALMRSFRTEEAIEQLELANEMKADDPDTLTLLSVAKGILQEGTRGATEEYRKILQVNPSAHFVHSNLLFNLSFDATCTAEEYLLEARRFGLQLQRDLVNARRLDSIEFSNSGNGRIRLGMVSGDLHMHPVGFFLDALLSNIDRNQFSIYLYSNSFKEDVVTARLRTFADSWQNLRFSDDHQAAQRIANDQIDVLFDLGGHTGKSRLGIFSIRAAPIQVTWLGYWASTGLNTMDYILADPLCLPPDDESHYVEKVLRMPVTRLCFGQSLEWAPPPSPSPWSQNGYVTFGCAQSLHKIGPDVLAAWNSILAAVPTAHLRLRNLQFIDQKVQQATLARLEAAGLPLSRTHVLPPLTREGYLQGYSEIDVCLDTFPFPGGTTTCDAMWMGVPSITQRGRNMVGRQGEAMMCAAGLADWVADGTGAYIEKACSVGADPSGLPALRRGLRARVKASPLFDGPRFARDFGAVIEALVRKHSTEV